MQSILVIGGAGFIGSHTVVELIAAGFRPVVVDNYNNSDPVVISNLEKLLKQPIAFHELDYTDSAQLSEVIQTEHISGVIHFAAYKAVAESVAKPLKYYDNNVAGFVGLLETVIKQNISHFVFSSSAAVYGNPPGAKVTEQTVCNPTSPYGWSKYMDEIILRDSCSANTKLQGTALRYFNVVGSHESALIGELPKGKPQNLLPIIVQATTGQIPPLTVYGTDYPTADGTCERDYIHVVDLAKAHVKALQQVRDSGHNYEVYNIGTGAATSVLKLIQTFETVNKVTVPYSLGDRRAGDPVAYYASAEKAESELGWHATKSVEDAVSDAWRWQQTLSQPNR